MGSRGRHFSTVACWQWLSFRCQQESLLRACSSAKSCTAAESSFANAFLSCNSSYCLPGCFCHIVEFLFEESSWVNVFGFTGIREISWSTSASACFQTHRLACLPRDFELVPSCQFWSCFEESSRQRTDELSWARNWVTLRCIPLKISKASAAWAVLQAPQTLASPGSSETSPIG